MKIYQVVVLCCLLFPTAVLAQEEHNVKYGKISEEELKMTYYAKDSSAEAIVLHDEGSIEFGYDKLSGLKIIYSYFGRVKILKKSALDMGIIKILLHQGSYNELEILRNLDGCTYNLENGKIISTKLRKDGIFHEHILDKQYQEKFTLPNLKEGSVFEYRYVTETPMSIRVNPNTWTFQSTHPVQWSELKISIPSYLSYRILKSGYLPISDETGRGFVTFDPGLETNTATHRYIVKDAPAFHTESYISTRKDYISKVDFQLTGVDLPDGFTSYIKKYSETWEDVSNSVLKSNHYEETFRHTGFLASAIKKIKTEKDTLKRIQQAFEYISGNLTWNDQIAVFSQTDTKQVFENKKGNSTELNLMLIALLKEVGLNANPVILSTRNHGSIAELFPSLNQFNYTIACVQFNGKDILMDATDPLTKPGMLPMRCLNGLGRLIGTHSRFVSLVPTQKKSYLEMMNISLNTETGELTGNTIITADGYAAHEFRKTIKEDGEEGLMKEIKNKNAEWEIEHLQLEHAMNISEPLKISYEFKFPDNITTPTIYFNPMISDRLKKNPFNEQERIYPVDLVVASDHTFIITIKIPSGYKVEEVPKSVSVALPDNLGRFSYMTAVTEDAIKINSRILMNESFFAPEEYQHLKQFYELIIQKHAEQVVLKKK